MRKLMVKKDKHQFKPNRPFGVFLTNTNKKVRYKVKFDSSCRYSFEEYEGTLTPINKIFGLSLGHHHTNSARFGWVYDRETDKIKLYTYGYNNRARHYFYDNTKKLQTPNLNFANIDINEEVILEIEFLSYVNTFIYKMITTGVTVKNAIAFQKIKGEINSWGYYLSPYFGGPKPAPHRMKIEMKRIKNSKIKELVSWYNAALSLHYYPTLLTTALLVLLLLAGSYFISPYLTIGIACAIIIPFVVTTIKKLFFNKKKSESQT